MLRESDVLLIGGDKRSVGLAERLSEVGLMLSAWQLPGAEEVKGLTVTDDWRQALSLCRAVVLPMPAFDSGLRVCKTGAHTLSAEALFEAVGGRLPVFGGRLSGQVLALAETCGVRAYDYSVGESVQIRNAALTAEGAIFLAMQGLESTIAGTKMAVLGYGRIGEALSKRLQALGAVVSVGARKETDLVRIQLQGAQAMDLVSRDWTAALTSGELAVVFNTVPHQLIDDDLLSRIPSSVLLIELASAPGGWNESKTHVCRTVAAPGLPGVYAPKTAGALLADEIIKIWRGV